MKANNKVTLEMIERELTYAYMVSELIYKANRRNSIFINQQEVIQCQHEIVQSQNKIMEKRNELINSQHKIIQNQQEINR